MNSILISLTIITLSFQANATSRHLLKDSPHSTFEPRQKIYKDTARPKGIDGKKSEYSTRNDVLGVWAVIGEENAAFYIQKNRIINPEDTKEYRYEIIKDSIRFDYGRYKVICKVELHGKDTMILKGRDTIVYYRFRQ